MKSEEIRKLVGGYATGILTEAERKALFEAALADQDLFDELAGEQALKELLEDHLARRQLLDAVGEKPTLVGMVGRPQPWAMAGGLATVVLLVMVFVRPGRHHPRWSRLSSPRREAAPMADLERREQPSQAAPERKVSPKPKALPSIAAEPAENAEGSAAKDVAAEMHPSRRGLGRPGGETAPVRRGCGPAAR